MKDETALSAVGVLGVVILASVALIRGVDGVVLMSSLALIGGLAGYQVGKWRS